MLYVKIMSEQDIHDTESAKNYRLVPVENNEVMQFVNNDNDDDPETAKFAFALEVHGVDGTWETHPLYGNAYVMNEYGKTIASHAGGTK